MSDALPPLSPGKPGRLGIASAVEPAARPRLPPLPPRRLLVDRSRQRCQRQRDEWLSAATHGLAAVAAAAWAPVLLARALAAGWGAAAAACVFVAALVATFVASTGLHLARFDTPCRRRWGLVDRCAIYFLIAGTYTPVAGLNLPSPWNLAMLAGVWAVALAGMAANTVCYRQRASFQRLEPVNLLLYLGLGWIGPVAGAPLFGAAFSGAGLAWLACGGLFYTGGVAFYVWRRLPYHHTIWHLWVMAGAACHGWAIMAFALPAG